MPKYPKFSPKVLRSEQPVGFEHSSQPVGDVQPFQAVTESGLLPPATNARRYA